MAQVIATLAQIQAAGMTITLAIYACWRMGGLTEPIPWPILMTSIVFWPVTFAIGAVTLITGRDL